MSDAARPPRRDIAKAPWLTAYAIAGAVAFFGVWQLYAMSGLVSEFVLPSPVAVLQRIYQLETKPFAGHLLHEHMASSILRFLYGWLLAVVVGVPLGLLMGRFAMLDEIVTPVFEGYRYVAPLAWVPFAALWFGTGIGGPILVIFTGAFAPCVINAYRGSRLVEPRYIEAAQTHGAGNLRILFEVLLPGSLPSIVAGLRVSAGLAWQSLIGAELIVVSAGIGYVMVQGQSNLSPSTVMSGMVMIGLFGILLDISLRWLERRVSAKWGQ